MKNTPFLLLLLLLGLNLSALANHCTRGKKEDPDISGMIVQSESGKPLKSVFITAYNVARKEKITFSDANGSYNIIDLKPGIYKFVFEKDGFKKVVKERVVLKINEDYQMNIEMSEEEAAPFDLLPSPLHLDGPK